MPSIHESISSAVATALDALGAGTIDPAVEPCARPDLGDWSTPAALRAARVLRRSPMQIATELRDHLAAGPPVRHVAEWAVSAPGYVNARLDPATWAPEVMAAALALDPAIPLSPGAGRRVAEGKTLIEHTSINTNKAAHIGHLRNACIGDTVARLLRRLGGQVEVQNYIDDTGAQVADVVVGIRELGIQQRDDEPFDQFCSRAYVEVVRRYESEPQLLERRRATLRAIEEGDTTIGPFAKELAGRIVDAHLATMARFDITYDLLSWESDILHLGFWQAAFAQLRDAGVIRHVEDGRNAGTWVLPHVEPGTADGIDHVPDGGGVEDAGSDVDAGASAADQRDKVLVKSDGVATYTAKDIAYQLWKFGLLGVDFHYRPWHTDGNAGPATTQSSADNAVLDGRGYGYAQRVITVVDARQAYPQGVVRAALARLGHTHEADNSTHLGYEVVALTPRAAVELGLEVGDGAAPVALSGRRGIEVRVDDLLDRAMARVVDKARDASTASALAAGAIRWYLLKFTLPVMIVFDFDDALRTTGDTGVYVQYAHARAAGILRRVPNDAGEPVPPHELLDVERALLRLIEAYPSTLAEAADALSPSVLTTYGLALASALSDLYEHTPPMIREEDLGIRRFRRALVAATKATLADLCSVIGMQALDTI